MILLDWTLNEHYEQVLNKDIDIVIATDVIYKGSPYTDLCLLLKEISSNRLIDIKIIIPKQRDCREDFLSIMKEKGGFKWNFQ